MTGLTCITRWHIRLAVLFATVAALATPLSAQDAESPDQATAEENADPVDAPAEVEAEPAPAPPPPTPEALPGQFAETVTVTPPAVDRDPTVWNFQIGSTLNAGNTRSWALAAATHFEQFWNTESDLDHLVTTDVQFTYGLASLKPEGATDFGDWNANAQNLLAKLRYDLFLSLDDSLFVALWGRNDPFAGLDFRFQSQLGYARNFFREGAENKHRFWGEVGFDFTFDDRVVPPMTAMMMTFPETEYRVSGRVFLGYDNHLSDNWSLLMGIEALLPFAPPDQATSPTYDLRLNSVNELKFKVDDNFQASLRVAVLYDNQPVPGKESLDTTTVLNLIYTLL